MKAENTVHFPCSECKKIQFLFILIDTTDDIMVLKCVNCGFLLFVPLKNGVGVSNVDNPNTLGAQLDSFKRMGALG